MPGQRTSDAPAADRGVADEHLEKATPADEVDVQLRLENSAGGRVVISLLIALLLGSVLVINMPASKTKDALIVATGPVVNVLGLDQGWAVYAPAPRRVSAYLEARVTDQDGTVTVRPIPIQHGLAEYWDYRWQRWGDTLLNGPENRERWAPYCLWVANEERAAGRHPAKVALVSIAAETFPPGPGPERAPWAEREFFTLGVAP
jgi:hypothetical protein